MPRLADILTVLLNGGHTGRPEGCYSFYVTRATDDITSVTLRLETGRTHQIRVHMSYLGHPLCGDTLYGGTRQKIGRQALL